MSSALGLTPRYTLSLTASFLLWIVPVNVKAPKFVVFLSFLASGCGYLYAFTIATPMSDQNWYNASKRQQERDIMTHDLALEQLAAEEALNLHYFGEAQFGEKDAIAASSQEQLHSSPAQKQLPARQIPSHLKFLVDLAQDNGGKVTVRQVGRAFRQLSADQIKALFEELAKMQLGTVKTDKNSVVFELSQQLS